MSKFRVGDKVRCVDDTRPRLSRENVYAIIDVDDVFVKVEENGIYSGENRFELVEEGKEEPKQVVSDGGSSSYFFLPEHASELRHLIAAKDMSFARGNIFKACYRLGEKSGVDIDYDIRKMEFFVQELKEMRARGERV